jgi:membrane associated rhomboid family serine protease
LAINLILLSLSALVYLFPQQRLDIIFSSAAFFVAAAVCFVINLFLLLCSFYLRSLCRLLKGAATVNLDYV